MGEPLKGGQAGGGKSSEPGNTTFPRAKVARGAEISCSSLNLILQSVPFWRRSVRFEGLTLHFEIERAAGDLYCDGHLQTLSRMQLKH